MDKIDDELMKRRIKKVFDVIPIDSNALALISYRTAFWISEQFARFGDMHQLDRKDSDELCNVVCAISIHAIYNANKLVYQDMDLKQRYQSFEDYLVAEVKNSEDFSKYLNKTAEKLMRKAHSAAITPSYAAHINKANKGEVRAEHEPSKSCCSIM